MIRVRSRIIVNLSGGKGGVGTSTVTANMATVLGGPGGLGIIGLIDFAYSGNSTVGKLLGLNPKAPGTWDWLLMGVKPQVQQVNRIRVIGAGSIEASRASFMISYITAKYANEDIATAGDKTAEYLIARINEMIKTNLLPYAPSLILTDIPSTVPGPVLFSILTTADLVNIIVKAGLTHVDEAEEVLNLISIINDARARLGLNPLIVNLIVNQAYPGDSTASLLRARGPIHKAYTLPYSPTVQYVTDVLKDVAIRFDVPEDKYFGLWRRSLEDLAREEEVTLTGASSRVGR